MAIKQVGIFKLSEAATTASGAINVTRAMLNARQVVGTLQLGSKGAGDVDDNVGMCCDKSGNVYLSDPGNHVIIKINESGKINHLAGSAGVSGRNSALQNVAAADARFNTPKGICCDNSGTLYVADSGNNQIRTIRDGRVGVLAGNGAGTAGLVDTTTNPLEAMFDSPLGVAVDNAGVVYVADTGNYAIRKIYGSRVLNICGGASGNTMNARASNITGSNAFFAYTNAIAVDANGNIFVADPTNNVIKKITPNGWVYRFCGSGGSGHSLGVTATSTVPAEKAYTCDIAQPTTVQCDRVGNVYVTDEVTNYMRLIKLNQTGVPSNITEFHEAGADVRNCYLGMAVGPNGNVYVAMIDN